MSAKTEILDAIKKLSSGDYRQPIKAHGPSNVAVMAELENLRRTLIASELEYTKQQRDTESNVANIAHDLKTPLAVIAGYAECIEAGMTDKDYCALITEKTEVMNEQVIGIVEANRKKLKEEAYNEIIDLKAFLSEECELYRKLANDKEIEYVCKKFPKGEFYGNKIELASIVQNLISNAIKYTEKGGTVTVSCTKNTRYFLLKVKDNGIGISKADLPHIFEKYYMADKARSDSRNSGVGLYNVQQTVEAYGGFVKVKSRLGKGSSFHVNLPQNVKERVTFEQRPRLVKLLAVLSGFILFGPIYRIVKGIENNDPKNILATLLSLGFCVFIWLIDIIDVIVNGKLSLFVSDKRIQK